MTATGGDSGNPVTFSVDPATTNGACTLGPDGSTVTFRHAGTCVIDADQAGNDDYTAAATSQPDRHGGQGRPDGVTFTSTGTERRRRSATPTP